MKHLRVLTTIVGIGVLCSTQCFAAAPTPSRLNLFRDFRATNDLNITAGDRIQFGAEIAGGSANITIAGQFIHNTNASLNFTTSARPCGPLATDANFCATSVPYTPARRNGTWKAIFTNQTTSESTTVTLPDSSLIPDNPVPFVINTQVTTDSSGNPTISWTVPAGAVVNDLRVNVYDKSSLRNNGSANIIESKVLSPSATSYTPIVALTPGGNYALGVQVLVSRDGGPLPANSSNADILTRSNPFYSFTKPGGNSSPPVQIPQVGANLVYNFAVSDVGPSTTTLLDPPVAIGYDYAAKSGDPLFASVSLPPVGNSSYMVTYATATNQVVTVPVAANTQFFFPSGGVRSYSVRGIDASASLDPSNAGAFVTAVTFATAGAFNGTMTPVTVGNTLFSSTLPASRSVQVGNTATAFATILNAGTASVSGCSLIPATNVPASFSYQTTDPQTNALTGTANTPATIAAGGSQTFVLAFTPSAAMPPTDVSLGYVCTSSTESVPTIIGVNSLQLVFDDNPVPDIVALAATTSNDGFVNLSPTSLTGAFSVATVNVGASGNIKASTDTGATSLPITIAICETNPDGSCKAPPSATVSTSIASNGTPTFSVFVTQSAAVVPDPATKRIFVRFTDDGGVVRGSTSVAVKTTAPDQRASVQ